MKKLPQRQEHCKIFVVSSKTLVILLSWPLNKGKEDMALGFKLLLMCWEEMKNYKNIGECWKRGVYIEVYKQRNTDEGRVWWEIGIQMKRWSEGKKHLNRILKMHRYSSGLLGDMCYKQRTAEKIFGSLQWYVGDGICLKWIDDTLYGMEWQRLIEKENINIPCLNISYKETLVI